VNNSIFTPSRPEGTWIEGILGSTTIYPEEIWYINRPGMIDRAYAGNLISLAIPTAFTNSHLYIRNQSYSEGIPYNPNISVFNHGAFANFLTIQDKLIQIEIKNNNLLETLNLNNDFKIVSVKDTSVSNKYFQLITTYVGISTPIIVEKKISLESESKAVTISFKINSLSSLIYSISFSFTDLGDPSEEEVIQKTYISKIERINNVVSIIREDNLGNPIIGRLILDNQPQSINIPSTITEAYENYLTMIYSPLAKKTEISFKVECDTKGYSGIKFKVDNLNNIIKKFNVGFLVVRRVDSYSNPIYIRMGFPLVYENWNYSIYKVTK
jgi:hypothetical protein